jgi:glycosyltransferase involved in cell wall biosynthesis
MINCTVVSIVLNNFKNDSRVLKENISLKNAGYCVQVVALHEDPLKEFDKMQDIPVHRIKLTSRGWSKNPVIQLLKYFEFVIRVIKKYRKSDILHCNDLNTLPIGILIKLFFNRKAKVVYDAHEYETEVNGLYGFKKIIIKITERLFVRYADKVITVSDSIANEYKKLYNIEKPGLVLNCPNYQKVEKQDKFRNTCNISKDQAIFLYQGALSRGRGVEILLEVFSQITDKDKVIIFMGYGELEQVVRDYAQQSNNIFFHPAVSSSILLQYTASADYGVSFIEDSCLSYRYCLPNKVFEYLMVGLPVLVSNLPEMKSFVEKNNLGVVAEDNTVEGFGSAVEASLNQNYKTIKKNALSICQQYSWEEQEKVLLDIYGDLI